MKNQNRDFNTQLNKGVFYFLFSRRPNKLFLALLLGLAGGVTYSSLIPLLLISVEAIQNSYIELISTEKIYVFGYQIHQPKLAIAFLSLCVTALVFRAASQIMFGKILTESASELRVYLCERIYQLPTKDLESIGNEKFSTAVNLDIPRFVAGAALIPGILVNTIIILATLLYLALLHYEIFLFIIGTLTFGVATYRVFILVGQYYFTQSRKSYSQIQCDVEELIHGSKELKLNFERYMNFKNSRLLNSERKYLELHNRGNTVLYFAIQYGNSIGLLMAGVIVFCAANLFSLTFETLTVIIVAVLYLTGPVNSILSSAIPFAQSRVALDSLISLIACMPKEHCERSTPLDCNRIEFRDVKFKYCDRVTIGPVNLTLNSGKIYFVVGSNGSGKSTLAKIASTHYSPSSGGIYFDDQLITDQNLSAARSHISAIFTDYHLFDRLYGHSQPELEKAQYLLERLYLDKIVKLNGNQFSTIDLSEGQKKRLALVVAFLEDRKYFVFDEWAAEQDPQFKSFFYEELLPELKRKEKIVFVVGHDDMYFHVADRLVVMEMGKVIPDSPRTAIIP